MLPSRKGHSTITECRATDFPLSWKMDGIHRISCFKKEFTVEILWSQKMQRIHGIYILKQNLDFETETPIYINKVKSPQVYSVLVIFSI